MLITMFAAIGRSRRNMLDLPSWQSRSSYGSAFSAYSILSLGSLLSAGSVLSIGSAGSILTVGSAGSILSIGGAGSKLSMGKVPDLSRAAALQEELAEDLSRISARLRSRAKHSNASRLSRKLQGVIREAGGGLAR